MQLRNPDVENALPRLETRTGNSTYLPCRDGLLAETARWARRVAVFLPGILLESPLAALALTMLVPLVFMR